MKILHEPGRPSGAGAGGTGAEGTGAPAVAAGGSGSGPASVPPTAARPRRPRPVRATLAHHVARPLLGLLALVVMLAASVVLVRLGNGDFSSAYGLTASFSKASPGLHPGSQVLERGVQIGSVRSIRLSHGRAVVTFGIASQYRLPSDSVATIEPQNLFGADQVTISVPAETPTGTRDLANGGRIAKTRVLDELGQLFSTADPLLSRIDTADLARVVGELAAAYGGQGHLIASSLDAGTHLAGLLARTTQSQLVALDAFTRFNLAVEGEGPTFNHLGSDANLSLPLFNAAAADYARLLTNLAAFSSQFAALLQDYRPKIDTILVQGDNVLRVLLAQRSDVASLVQGLAQYAVRFAHGSSAVRLPDGSKVGYFKTFVLWGDVQHLVCGLIAPAAHGLSFLKPLQAALLGHGSPLNCTAELAAFQSAQANPRAPGVPKPRPSATSGSASGSGLLGSLPGNLNSTANQLAGGLYGALGQAQAPTSTSIGSYLGSLLEP